LAVVENAEDGVWTFETVRQFVGARLAQSPPVSGVEERKRARGESWLVGHVLVVLYCLLDATCAQLIPSSCPGLLAN
jgi:hypothetical protein